MTAAIALTLIILVFGALGIAGLVAVIRAMASKPREAAPVPPSRPLAVPDIESVLRQARAEHGPGDLITLALDGAGYWTNIVGEMSYKETIRRIDGGRRANGEEVLFRVVIRPEVANPYDAYAIRVDAEGGGQVGYFARAEVENFRAMRDLLLEQNGALSADAKLIGYWGEDEDTGREIPPGVMVMLPAPDAFGAPPRRAASPTPAAMRHEPSQVPAVDCTVADWRTRPRVHFPTGKPRPVSDESTFQAAIRAVVGVRDPAAETVTFAALLVPDPENPSSPDSDCVMVCAEDHGPVGRLSKTDARKYLHAFQVLHQSGAVAMTDGWVVPEGARLGVRLSLCTTEEAMAATKQGGEPVGTVL